MAQIKRSRAECLECGTVLESTFRHDYVTCACPNNTMLDGGLDYVRFGGVDHSKIKLMTEYWDEGAFIWGVMNYDTCETEPRDIRDLTDSHVQNIALHLRTRWEYTGNTAKRAQDLDILERGILPELERRGLEEVLEEEERK